MQIFWTVTSGTLVFVLGQLILNLFIEPIQSYRRTVSNIAHALVEYANVYANSGVIDKRLERKASKVFRKLASDIHSHIYLLPYYECISSRFLKIFPPRDVLIEVSNDLIGLSNGIAVSNTDLIIVNQKKAEKIYTVLGIYVVKGMTVNDYLSNRIIESQMPN
jgi:hypothetical protein